MQKLSVTIPEAVTMTGISRTSLYKLFADGTLVRRKHGKRSLILVEDLERVIRALPTAEV
ncbi:helix-turn-helix domain-containing protein [Aminobacter sp. LjRoot7]|jgi:hypothetical protein|uniref:helix-turn-helix domain-containing protein n=1 Tax=Aminobacter sp. LjRoot7 TaxID=3342335 RepID=UPI003ED08DC0